MTAPMTDDRLAELRKARDEGRPIQYSGSDFRSLLARLDAAEELIREVAQDAVESKFTIEISEEILAKCRSYLR